MTHDFHLGFVSARSAFPGDGVWTDAGLGRLIDALGRSCSRLTVALSGSPEHRALFDHRLDLAEADFLPLPFLASVREGFFQAAACRRVLRQLEKRCDVVLVQLPFAAPLALLGARRPRLYHVCADVLAQVRTSPWYRGPRRIPALGMAHFIDRLQRFLLHRPATRAVTNGRRLLEHYGEPPGRWVISSTLEASEVDSVRRSRPPDAPFRVLFVGYLRHEKGFDVLLEAFRGLLRRVPNAELEIVGASDYKDTGVAEQLRTAMAELDRQGRLRLAGQQNFGTALFQRFADADVLAVPSRSEGTPRVLVEARAFGCPVVASRVGGIPSSVDDGVDGLLVPPDDPEVLEEALFRVADDDTLRLRLVETGLDHARRHTVEAFAEELLEELDRLVPASDTEASRAALL